MGGAFWAKNDIAQARLGDSPVPGTLPETGHYDASMTGFVAQPTHSFAVESGSRRSVHAVLLLGIVNAPFPRQGQSQSVTHRIESDWKGALDWSCPGYRAGLGGGKYSSIAFVVAHEGRLTQHFSKTFERAGLCDGRAPALFAVRHFCPWFELFGRVSR